MSKVTMELSATTALNILGFLKEFEQELNLHPLCRFMLESYQEFEAEINSKMTQEQFEDAVKEIKIAVLMGKAPDNAKSGSIFNK
jgi:hypothetical protein